MKPAIRCSECTKDKKCLQHYDFDESEYIALPPDLKTKRAMALEQENKLLLEALWHCGADKNLATIEAGVRALIPGNLADKIDFKKVESAGDKYLDNRMKKSRCKCEICGDEIWADSSGTTEWYAGSTLRLMGIRLTFRIDKEWVICGKCGDKIHERLQQGEDRDR